MSEGDVDGNLSTMTNECPTSGTVRTQTKPPPEDPSDLSAGSLGLWAWLGLLMLAYLGMCWIWPALPVSFLAILTAGGMTSAWNSISSETVSSQTPRIDQAKAKATTDVKMGGITNEDRNQVGSHLTTVTPPDSLCTNTTQIKCLSGESLASDPSDTPQCLESVCQNTCIQRELQSASALNRKQNCHNLKISAAGIDSEGILNSEEENEKNEGTDRGFLDKFVPFPHFPAETTSVHTSNAPIPGQIKVPNTKISCRSSSNCVTDTHCDAPKNQKQGKKSPGKVSVLENTSPGRSKCKPTHKAVSRLRLSASETATARRRGIPAFGKVWREPEVRGRAIEMNIVGDSPQFDRSSESFPNTEKPQHTESHPGFAYHSSDFTSLKSQNSCDQTSKCLDDMSSQENGHHDCPNDSTSAWSGNIELCSDTKVQLGRLVDSTQQNKEEKTAHVSETCSKLPPEVLRRTNNDEVPLKSETTDVQTQTSLFADILRINLRKHIQTETRKFHTRRSRLRFKYTRELEKLKRELSGKNRILSSLQLKIPSIEEENRRLRTEKEDLDRCLQDEQRKCQTLMGRLKDVYDRLMVINSAQLLQQQHAGCLQYDQPM